MGSGTVKGTPHINRGMSLAILKEYKKLFQVGREVAAIIRYVHIHATSSKFTAFPHPVESAHRGGSRPLGWGIRDRHLRIPTRRNPSECAFRRNPSECAFRRVPTQDR